MSTNLSIRTDKEVKERAEKVYGELGLTLSSAINIFLRQSIRENGLPFALKLDKPNAETLEALEESKQIKAHPEKYRAYSSVEELWADLDE